MSSSAPEERNETIRKEIIDLLKGPKQTIGSLSKHVRKQEKEIAEHLKHICKSENVIIEPAECIKCGYVFEDRVKIKKPSKCPICKGTYIDDPMFSIR
ncbi:MAG: hypothetical protein MI867_29700 [Pseudomonadales bacterium]|nr:hypothetical protein [Pseudomonadales bacterium]